MHSITELVVRITVEWYTVAPFAIFGNGHNGAIKYKFVSSIPILARFFFLTGTLKFFFFWKLQCLTFTLKNKRQNKSKFIFRPVFFSKIPPPYYIFWCLHGARRVSWPPGGWLVWCSHAGAPAQLTGQTSPISQVKIISMPPAPAITFASKEKVHSNTAKTYTVPKKPDLHIRKNTGLLWLYPGQRCVDVSAVRDSIELQ